MHLESLSISQRWLIYKGDEWKVFAWAHKDVKDVKVPKGDTQELTNNYL